MTDTRRTFFPHHTRYTQNNKTSQTNTKKNKLSFSFPHNFHLFSPKQFPFSIHHTPFSTTQIFHPLSNPRFSPFYQLLFPIAIFPHSLFFGCDVFVGAHFVVLIVSIPYCIISVAFILLILVSRSLMFILTDRPNTISYLRTWHAHVNLKNLKLAFIICLQHDKTVDK